MSDTREPDARPRIVTAREPDLDVAEFRRVLAESGLGAQRPVGDHDRLRRMIEGASLIVTARLDTEGRPLIGVARGISDGAWACYLAEVAVTKSAQGFGVGQALIEAARAVVGPEVAIFLASVPEAAGFYERIGMARLDDAFWFRRER